ncbi:MAG: hypothetical protein ACK5U7_13795 [Bacteroidota bacterium]|jgi:hypothetical protein
MTQLEPSPQLAQTQLSVKPISQWHAWKVYSRERSTWRYQGFFLSITKTKSVVIKKAKADSPVLRRMLLKCNYQGTVPMDVEMMLVNARKEHKSWPSNYMPDRWGEYDLVDSQPQVDPFIQ